MRLLESIRAKSLKATRAKAHRKAHHKQSKLMKEFSNLVQRIVYDMHIYHKHF